MRTETHHRMLAGTLACVFAAGWLASSGCVRQDNVGPVADLDKAQGFREAMVAAEDVGGAGGGTAGPVGTGWATIRGRFVYDISAGPPPAMPPYNVDKDFATCAPGGRAPLQQTLVVDKTNGGIENIVIYLRDASRVHESAQPNSQPVIFDQKTCKFLTHVLPVVVGQTIELVNSDPVGHNTKINGRSNKFNQTIPVGATIPYVPQREESTPASVQCSIHPWMQAYLLPRENGYVAVTAADGSFEIANLPAGEELEFQAWHESATGVGNGLVLASPAAKELHWTNKGRFTVTLKPDETLPIELTVPASAFGG